MDWKTLLADITGSVDQELLLRNEYLVTENRLLRNQIQGRVRLTDGERKTLAEIGQRLGKHVLAEIATIVKPDTILAWHRTLVAVLVAPDFFSAEVWTLGGLVTDDVVFLIRLSMREVHVAGVTPHPNHAWMMQIARNLPMEAWGFLSPGQYLIHDRDGTYCSAFQRLMDAAGVTRIPLPPRSPNLNAYAEHWVRSVKDEALSRLILFGERSLRHALSQYTSHFHEERPHQGIGKIIPFPTSLPAHDHAGTIQCHERVGGLLRYDDRRAA